MRLLRCIRDADKLASPTTSSRSLKDLVGEETKMSRARLRLARLSQVDEKKPAQNWKFLAWVPKCFSLTLIYLGQRPVSFTVGRATFP